MAGTIEQFNEQVARIEALLLAVKQMGFGEGDVTFEGVTRASLEKRFQEILDASDFDFEVAMGLLDEMTEIKLAAATALDLAPLVKGYWPSTAGGIGNGVAGHGAITPGTGGTNGTYPLVTSAGGQVIAARGWIYIAGGGLSQIKIDHPGHYTGTPLLDLTGVPGLGGASATLIVAANTPVGGSFLVGRQRYRVDAGPVAVIDGPPLADAVSVAQKLDAVVSRNLFNPDDSDVALGYFPNSATGSLQANVSYNCSGYIPVVAGQSYTFSFKHYVVWYNAAKGYISGSSGADGNKTQVAPAGAAYVRASASLINWPIFQVEVGAAQTSYEPFGRFVAASAIKDASISGAKIVASAVGYEHVDFLSAGKNLFNKAAVTLAHYLGHEGSIVADATYDYSGFIAVEAGQSYKSSHNMRFTTFYDAAKARVDGGSAVNTTSIVVPTGVAYVRVTISHVNLAAFQLEVGAAATAYESYGWRLRGPNGEVLLLEPPLPATITTDTLVDGSVTPAKTSFLQPSKNLFDKAASVIGFFLGHDGTAPVANATYDYSGFIAVAPGQSYVANRAMRFTTFYNSAKAFVSGGSSVSTTSIVVPAGVAYVRVTISHVNLDDFQLEEGTEVTAFSPYGYELRLLSGGQIFLPSTDLAVLSDWEGKSWATLGDSITAGGGWQGYVTSALGLVVTNFGVGGTRISGAAGSTTAMCQDARIDAIPADTALVTVMGGTNDWAQSVPLGATDSSDPLMFFGALNTMLAKLMGRFPSARVVLCTTPYGELPGRLTDGSGWTSAHTNLVGLTTRDYADAIRIACARWGIPCIDVATAAGWNRVNITYYMVDDGGLLHPNALGRQRLASIIIGGLKAIVPVG